MAKRNKKTVQYSLIVLLSLYLISALWLQSAKGIQFYIPYVYLPLQRIRNTLFHMFRFSIGDIVYIILLAWLLYTLFKLIQFLFTWRKNKKNLLLKFGRISMTLVFLYASFIILWGANYNRPKLISDHDTESLDKNALIALNDSLVHKLNTLNPHEQPLVLSELNKQLSKDYSLLFGPKVPELMVKPTVFGNMLHYFGIQGYYNPLSGEGQFAASLPQFMWGFVIAHEMAHQAGIASEGEANFLAYVVCVQDSLAPTQYSGYFNLFLYANRELAETDSALALAKYEALNPSTRADIQTLKNMRQQYRSIFRGLSLDFYNWYLQNRGLKQGIRSYRQIARNVYDWEQKGKPAIALYP
ncbi:hypothetical protein DBR32_01520 [Taibaiella sp. KBW10]|uniref:DUF3810 domain-containing protein n=1 Tax=Taibaiella sp. KBW10 TaxID=2153357 RepID=UPI000F5A20E2|nr:DUF3810 domain-containing protein [Taibaiella sp. KBW10]RQO32315.1 hypothetical protein DBR32_01520 [Taibaiella sp. KBW10]